MLWEHLSQSFNCSNATMYVSRYDRININCLLANGFRLLISKTKTSNKHVQVGMSPL